jgi:hypothetical protein
VEASRDSRSRRMPRNDCGRSEILESRVESLLWMLKTPKAQLQIGHMPDREFVVLPHPYVHITRRIAGQARDSELASIRPWPKHCMEGRRSMPKALEGVCIFTTPIPKQHSLRLPGISCSTLLTTYLLPYSPLHYPQPTITTTKKMDEQNSPTSLSCQQSDTIAVAVSPRRPALAAATKIRPVASKHTPAAEGNARPAPARACLARRAKDQSYKQTPEVGISRPHGKKRQHGDGALEELSDGDQDVQPVFKKPRITANTTLAIGNRPPFPDHAESQHPSAYDFSSLPDADRYLVDEKIQFLGRSLELPEEEVLNMAKLSVTNKCKMQFNVDDDEFPDRKKRKSWGR